MHIPERMCVACRQMKPKGELIRIVKSGDMAELDISGKHEGRGAYICRNAECITAAKKRRALSRHFKRAIDDEIYDAALRLIGDE